LNRHRIGSSQWRQFDRKGARQRSSAPGLRRRRRCHSHAPMLAADDCVGNVRCIPAERAAAGDDEPVDGLPRADVAGDLSSGSRASGMNGQRRAGRRVRASRRWRDNRWPRGEHAFGQRAQEVEEPCSRACGGDVLSRRQLSSGVGQPAASSPLMFGVRPATRVASAASRGNRPCAYRESQPVHF
jgi:hypothetical protein